MASENLQQGTLFPFCLPLVFLSFFFLAECVLVEQLNGKCILYVPGKIHKIKEPLTPFKMAVAASASSGSATGKTLVCGECRFFSLLYKVFTVQYFRAGGLFAYI
jgi:hypothetical protein